MATDEDSGHRILRGIARDIDGLPIARLLPTSERRTVGPFVFFDHIAPTSLGADGGINVRPHPHIGLATLTWLFEGAIAHRDSTGAHQVIAPGAVNWMVAGRGVVHSERPVEPRPDAIHCAQFWVALPAAQEEIAPFFEHHAPAALPKVSGDGWSATLIAGSLFGATAPATVFSPLGLGEIRGQAGTVLPPLDGYDEVGVFVARGRARLGTTALEAGELVVVDGRAAGADALTLDTDDVIVLIVAGDRLEGPRYLDWNFVSSRPERLKEAREAWRNQAFPKVPGDSDEFIPLPERH